MKLTEEERKRRSDAMKKINAERTPEEHKKANERMNEARLLKWKNDPEFREYWTENFSRKWAHVLDRWRQWKKLHESGTEYDDD